MWGWILFGTGIIAAAGGPPPVETKRVGVRGRAAKTPTPKRLAKQTDEEFLAQWRLSWEPVYLYSHGCKPWYWGFNVAQIAADAAAYGGAKIVAQIMDWIMAYTGMEEVTDYLNLKFKFMLNKYSIATEDDDGAWVVTASKRKRIERWTNQKGVEPPPVPLEPAEGWTVAWMSKERGGIWEDDDEVITILRPIPREQGPVYAGMPLWEWTWLISTTRLRALLRHDKINLSAIAKVQCKPSYYWPVLRRYVDEIYK